MRLTADYHTHTSYSDGKSTLLENAMQAKKVGLKAIGATEHGFSHKAFGLKRKEFDKYVAECREAEKQSGVKVLIGLESNIQGRSGKCDILPEEYEKFDIFLCGIHVYHKYESMYDMMHMGFGCWLRHNFRLGYTKKMVQATTTACLNAIKNNPVDIFTHANYLCQTDVVEIAKCCRDYGTYMEISAKKTHLTDEELQKVVDTGVRFVVNSDAHYFERIGDCTIAEEQIMRVGVPLDRIDNIDGKEPTFRFAEYKKRNL